MADFGPGSVLGGRYRIDVLLSEVGDAKFWLGIDTSLGRKVAIHTVPNTDPRAARLLQAARASASVVEAHLLRVLDCTVEDELTWAVNEWGEGITLHDLLGNGPLPFQRAAWLSLQVATAVAHAHREGVAHARLNPESVMVTHTGEVKIIGFVINGAIRAGRAQTSRYRDLEPLEADVVDLAAIVYAATTARWPGYSPSAVQAPPFDLHGALRPRQVRAGVPRDLDGLCLRVLREESFDHSLPIESAHEIEAALSDFVGNPDHWAPKSIAEMLTAPKDVTLPHPRPSDSWLHSGLIPVIDAVLASEVTDPEPQPSQPEAAPADGLLRPTPNAGGREGVEGPETDLTPGTDRWLFGDQPTQRAGVGQQQASTAGSGLSPAARSRTGHRRAAHQDHLVLILVILTLAIAMVVAFILGMKG